MKHRGLRITVHGVTFRGCGDTRKVALAESSVEGYSGMTVHTASLHPSGRGSRSPRTTIWDTSSSFSFSQ